MLQRQFAPTELTQLLGVELGAINGIRKGLQTVLDDGDTLRFRHQSFVDFLIGGTEGSTNSPPNDQHACPERFRINVSEAHGRLCESLFKLMHKELHFNICNIPSSFLRNRDLPQGHFDNAISRSLAYACKTWGFHLSNAGSELNIVSVETFIHEHFLPWIECLSGLWSMIDTVLSLTTLQVWLSSQHKQVSIRTFYVLPMLNYMISPPILKCLWMTQLHSSDNSQTQLHLVPLTCTYPHSLLCQNHQWLPNYICLNLRTLFE